MPEREPLRKRIIGALYSATAERLYEPVVVRRMFPLLGGDLNTAVLDQGRRAVAAAGPAPILDMPVGTAYFTIATARRHDSLVVGADLAAGMVREAARAARGTGVVNLVVLQADAHRLPFADGAFGAALCTNGLQVIPGLDPTLAELHRVLRPGGLLLVSVVNMPVGGLLPPGADHRLPTLLKGRRSIVKALADQGFEMIVARKKRFATLLQATKPASIGQGEFNRAGAGEP